MSKYYKGFDENFQCRGYQFKVGETYKHDGEVEACNSGFHSCSNPLDVLKYYGITSRFAVVEVGGKTETHEDDSKIASAEITIKAELNLPEFINDCINYIKYACKSDISPEESGDNSQLAASGNYSQLAALGDNSIAMCAGVSGKVKGGLNCALALTRWVSSEKRYRIATAYVGEDGIKADTWYKLNNDGKFVEA